MRNFQIVTRVSWSFLQLKQIGKQCLQTASASGTPYRGFAPGPHWGLPNPEASWDIPLEWKFLSPESQDGLSSKVVFLRDTVYRRWLLLVACHANLAAKSRGAYVHSALKLSCGSRHRDALPNHRYWPPLLLLFRTRWLTLWTRHLVPCTLTQWADTTRRCDAIYGVKLIRYVTTSVCVRLTHRRRNIQVLNYIRHGGQCEGFPHTYR